MKLLDRLSLRLFVLFSRAGYVPALLLALALSACASAPLAAAPRRPQPDPADRNPGPTRYHVVATVLSLTECQPGEQAPCYTAVIVDFVRDTPGEARDLARQISLEGCWQEDQSGETEGTYWPAHRVQVVRASPIAF